MRILQTALDVVFFRETLQNFWAAILLVTAYTFSIVVLFRAFISWKTSLMHTEKSCIQKNIQEILYATLTDSVSPS